jgi:chromosome segregation ATPase
MIQGVMDQTCRADPRRDFMEKTNPIHLNTVLSQIDDLQARLKVTVQRMAEMESDLIFSEEQRNSLLENQRNLQDQILIWKEKERLWIEKLVTAKASSQELENLKNEAASLRMENQRYIKYHEKIKLQIKPYIRQLKDYSRALVQELQETKRELLNRDYTVKKAKEREAQLEKKLEESHQLVNEHKLQIDKALQIALENHDKERQGLQRQIGELNIEIQTLRMKALSLDRTLERQDELQNLNVALKRKLDQQFQKFEQDTEGLRTSLQMARNEILKKNLQLETLQQTELEQKKLILQLQGPEMNSSPNLREVLEARVPQSVEL